MNQKRSSLFIAISLALSTSQLAQARTLDIPSTTANNFSGSAFTTNNPAQTALSLSKSRAQYGAAPSFAAGVEYGDFDELFDAINEVVDSFQSDGGSGSSGGGSTGPGSGIGGVLLPSPGDPDIDLSDLEPLITAVAAQAAVLGAFLGTTANEGYAKTFVESDIPITLGQDKFDGAWALNINYSAQANMVGLAQAIDFNPEALNGNLIQELASGQAGEYQLATGVSINVADNGDTSFQFKNDSAVLLRAAQITEYSLNYSRPMLINQQGGLYAGVTPRFYNVGLSRTDVKLGDITEPSELVDQISNADFKYQTNVGVDLGLIWASKNYQLGASITNINQPTFDYPNLDLSRYDSARVRDAISKSNQFEMTRQFQFDGGVFTENGHWGANLHIDANPAITPLGDEYQWAKIDGSYRSHSLWIPSARLGIHQNVAGTKRSYLNVGTTLLKVVNIDLSSTLHTVSLAGTTLPTGMFGRIGLDVKF